MLRGMRTPRRLLFGLVCLASLGVFGAWAAASSGEIPRYWDSRHYLILAERLRIDAYRGVAYPYLIAGYDRLRGEPRVLRPWLWEPRPDHPDEPYAFAGLGALQALQAAACAAAIAWFLHVLVDLRFLGSPRARWAGFALLFALLWLDPLVVHFDMAIMTDSLALSASLAFCTALARLAQPDARDGPRAVAAGVLVPSGFLAGTLRPEKAWVMLGTAIASAALWELWRRRFGGPATRRREGLAVALALLCVVAVLATHRALHQPGRRWPLSISILHLRVIYPNLERIYDALPPGPQQLLSREDAADYDRHINGARDVMMEKTRGRAALLEPITRAMAKTAWRLRGPWIVLDALKDAAENLVPTASFYARLAVVLSLDRDARLQRMHGGSWWTWRKLRERTPPLATAALATGGATFALALAASLAGLVCRRRGADAGPPIASARDWIPVAAFCATNGAAFAVTQDLVIIRYALAAHVALLALVYAGALRWAFGVPSGPERPGQGSSRA